MRVCQFRHIRIEGRVFFIVPEWEGCVKPQR